MAQDKLIKKRKLLLTYNALFLAIGLITFHLAVKEQNIFQFIFYIILSCICFTKFDESSILLYINKKQLEK